MFTDRGIVYRVNNGFDHFKVALSVGVMKMVRSDRRSSGVIFTLDTESGFRDVVFITGAYGLGENVVQGKVDPDEFYVHKPTFTQGHRAVLRRTLGQKQLRHGLAHGPYRLDHARRADRRRRSARASASTTPRCSTLADYAIRIEEHYSAARRPSRADGHRMGEGRRATASSTSCRRGRRRWRRGAPAGDVRNLRADRRAARCW